MVVVKRSKMEEEDGYQQAGMKMWGMVQQPMEEEWIQEDSVESEDSHGPVV